MPWFRSTVTSKLELVTVAPRKHLHHDLHCDLCRNCDLHLEPPDLCAVTCELRTNASGPMLRALSGAREVLQAVGTYATLPDTVSATLPRYKQRARMLDLLYGMSRFA